MEFTIYSTMNEPFRSETNYLKIKRLVLRLSQNKNFQNIFTLNPNYSLRSETAFNFALKYFDLEDESRACFYVPGVYATAERNMVYALSDFLTSLYESDRGFFQNFVSFVLNEGRGYFNSNDVALIKDELLALGFIYDGQILKTTSGIPPLEIKIATKVEEELQKINPELLKMRQGAVEELLSNKPDKDRHVSASCRALLNTLLRNLAPKVEVKEGESEIEKRVAFILENSKTDQLLVSAIAELIQVLNKAQAKGDHSSVPEETSIFVFEVTDKLIYYILSMRK